METSFVRPPESTAVRRTTDPALSRWLFLVASLLSLAAILYPLILPWLPSLAATSGGIYTLAAPLILSLVTGSCLLVIVMSVGASANADSSPAKLAALLGAIVAIDASIRLIPSFGGASPIFFLIILTGAVFGPRLGFLAGVLTILLSAFLTGGVGPWLPFQMIGAGWVGLGAGWVPRPASMAPRITLLAIYGAISGLLYGAMLSLYGWPFAAPGVQESASLFWSPDLTPAETISRYAAYYLATSLSHDLMRSIGNMVLIIALGAPLLVTLDRGRRRLDWHPGGGRNTPRLEPSQCAEFGSST